MLHQLDSSAMDVEQKQLAWRTCSEVLRIALSAVYTRGSRFRRQLLQQATNPIAAPPFEIGLDPRPVVYLAWKVEKGEIRHRFLCAVLLVSTVVAFLADAPGWSLAVLFLIAAVLCAVHYSSTQSEQARFSKTKFSRKTADKLLNEPHPETLDFGIGPAAQRALVYKGFDPFTFAGIPVGKWSFTVDVDRAAHSANEKANLTSVSALELETMIRSKLPQSGFGVFVSREIVAIKGEDAFVLPMICQQPDTQQPDVLLNDEWVRQICAKNPNLSRRYLLFHDIRWEGELILTHAVRACLQGKMFYVEASRFVLTPPSKDFKIIDRTIVDKSLFKRVVRFVGYAIGSPLLVLGETADLFAYFAALGSQSSIKKEYKRSLKNDPIYDYGAVQSIRRQIMDDKFDHFSQKADLDFAIKAFDQSIVEMICEYLEDHGVDVSGLRDKAMTIYNSGIMVQGGDVTAQAMAVGQGSAAQATTVAKNPLNAKASAS